MRISERQQMIVAMMSDGRTYQEIATHFDRAYATIKQDLERLAYQIESDYPTRVRAIVWYRLATNRDVLTGKKLPEKVATVDSNTWVAKPAKNK